MSNRKKLPKSGTLTHIYAGNNPAGLVMADDETIEFFLSIMLYTPQENDKNLAADWGVPFKWVQQVRKILDETKKEVENEG